MKVLGIMARDQHGTTYHHLSAKHPRKALAEALGVASSHLRKVYVDAPRGECRHIGYEGKGQWFTLYNVCSWEGQS